MTQTMFAQIHSYPPTCITVLWYYVLHMKKQARIEQELRSLPLTVIAFLYFISLLQRLINFIHLLYSWSVFLALANTHQSCLCFCVFPHNVHRKLNPYLYKRFSSVLPSCALCQSNQLLKYDILQLPTSASAFSFSLQAQTTASDYSFSLQLCP